jgi:hypothetical protein
MVVPVGKAPRSRHAIGTAYPMVYEMVYRRVAEAGASGLIDFGEPPGTRTQGPRLKRAAKPEENQDDTEP